MLRGLPLVSLESLWPPTFHCQYKCCKYVFSTYIAQARQGGRKNRKVSAKHVSNTAAGPKMPRICRMRGDKNPRKIVEWKTKSICMTGRLILNFLNFEVPSNIEMILITSRVEPESPGSTVKHWDTHKLLQSKESFFPESLFSNELQGTLTFTSNL